MNQNKIKIAFLHRANDSYTLERIEFYKKLCKYKLGSSSKWDEKDYRNNKINKKEIEERRQERVRLEKILKDNNEILKKYG